MFPNVLYYEECLYRTLLFKELLVLCCIISLSINFHERDYLSKTRTCLWLSRIVPIWNNISIEGTHLFPESLARAEFMNSKSLHSESKMLLFPHLSAVAPISQGSSHAQWRCALPGRRPHTLLSPAENSLSPGNLSWFTLHGSDPPCALPP